MKKLVFAEALVASIASALVTPRLRLMTIFFLLLVLGSAGSWPDHDAQRGCLAMPRRKPCDQIIDLAA